ncbi:hypothetical protein NONI108955_28335 [Nocardia ninae]|uniref:Pycsar effector protein domain-containing protein n=1 Tax=Nocardia ninae NBRC 108245 TaxID=1210091 RepID=A0A511MBE3_9NOCA|nr:hypothetical protein NN4_25030 [Nocardia ninae NBRC 108245]
MRESLSALGEVDRDTVPPWEDAKLTMTEFGNWIKNADTKLTVLAAALGIVMAAVASKADSFQKALANPEFDCKWTLIMALLLLLGAIVVTAGYLYVALVPRMTSMGSNRFAWPSVVAEGRPPWNLEHRSTLDEAWSQNHALAGIAGRKYVAFRKALRTFGIALLLCAVCIALATWQAAHVHGQ